jgi:hypothetical protein
MTNTDLLTRIKERRAARAARERLRAELASYSTESQRADLRAILARHSDDETAELEALLR